MDPVTNTPEGSGQSDPPADAGAEKPIGGDRLDLAVTDEADTELIGGVGVPDEDLEYAVAVAKKQAGVPLEHAAHVVGHMPADQVIAVVVAGRNGEVASCRKILGLE